MSAFSSAQTLLNSDALADLDCLITDIGMPGLHGFALQRLMNERRPGPRVILITGRDEIAALPQARHRWFFRKPFEGLAASGRA